MYGASEPSRRKPALRERAGPGAPACRLNRRPRAGAAVRAVRAAHEECMKRTGGFATRTGTAVLRMLDGARQHPVLARLYAFVPFTWRLALRRWVHAAAGRPMPPLPFPESGRSLKYGA